MTATGKKREQRIEWFLYGILFLLALFLRLYKLGELPYGIHIDEAGMGYDAYSIANWGIDRYYKQKPVYFINYGGGQSVLYGYCCAFLMKLLEPSVIVFRLPAVCFGMLTWFFGTLLIRELLGKRASFAGAALLAVCPCFILHSRLGLDCFLFLGTSTVSLYFLTQAAKAAGWKKTLLYGITGFCFGVCFYTYALSWLSIPVFLVFLLLYLLYIKEIQWKHIFCMGIPMGVLALPLIIMVLINALDLPEIITPYFTIPRLMEFRGAEISLKNVINNVPFLIQTYFFRDELTYNSVPTYFSLYLISIPFTLLGLRKGFVQAAVRTKAKELFLPAFLFFWFLAQTCMGLLIKEPNVNKLNGVFFVLLFFTVYGIKESYAMIQTMKWKRYFGIGIFGIYTIFSAGFVKYYFTEYTEDTFPLPYFDAGYADVLDEWGQVIGDRDIYVDSLYIFYPLGEKMSPVEFQLIEQGTHGRGNIHFGLPEEPKENSFYFIFREERYLDRLLEEGYTMEASGMYRVLYKQ